MLCLTLFKNFQFASLVNIFVCPHILYDWVLIIRPHLSVTTAKISIFYVSEPSCGHKQPLQPYLILATHNAVFHVKR